jgi:7-keto-8-aminopelargonate synthetase and related enzymes
MASDFTLAGHVVRRARLAGAAVLENGNPFFAPLDRLQAEAKADGGVLTSFANYDYLGISDHPMIKDAAHSALDRVGVGALGSRLVGGERLIHADFEKALAEFVGTEACLTLVSGYLTNLTTISHLLGKRDLIIYDELSHNSIVAGVASCKATAVEFRHNDMEHLRHILAEQRANHRNCLIVVESLYSMDGDIANLPELLKLKDEFQSWLLVDEAHSIGVLGKTGRGVCEHFGEDPTRIDLIIGTLSKTFVSCGGFICAQKPVLDWMRFLLPGFVYSVGLPPVIAAAAGAALQVIKDEPARVGKLQANAQYFLQKAREAGLSTGPAEGYAIVPVHFPDMKTTMIASDILMKNGIYAPPIVQVGVPKGLPRIRFFISARHSFEEIDRTVEVLRSYSASIAKQPVGSETVPA